jgi:ubiquitin carboxyl-terminal hydrolase 9/13
MSRQCSSIGCLCSYANSVLQALYFCIPFRELLLQYTDPSVSRYDSPLSLSSPQAPPTATSPRWKLERKASSLQTTDVPSLVVAATVSIPSAPPTLFSALRSLFLFISKNPAEKGTVAPRAFIDKLKEVNELFRSTMHQDAHEFSNYLLNKIVEEMEQECDRKASDLSSSKGTNSHAASTSTRSTQATTLVHRLFEGVLTSETRCMTCETVSSRDEAFLDLSVDIEQNSSISACLRQFSASEMLCQKNKFFCDSCCDLQEAEKR